MLFKKIPISALWRVIGNSKGRGGQGREGEGVVSNNTILKESMKLKKKKRIGSGGRGLNKRNLTTEGVGGGGESDMNTTD